MLATQYFTNEVTSEINRQNILCDYDLIKVDVNKSSKKGDYSKIWIYLKNKINVIAYYKSGSTIFLLTEKKEISKINYTETNKLKCHMKIIDAQTVNGIYKNILLNILIGLYGTSGNMFTLGDFQNGCFIIHDKQKSKVITMKFFIDKNNLLSLNVITFSKIKCTKTNINKYIFYTIEGNKLIRVLKPLEVEGDLFIQKNRGKKSKIDFINFEKDFLKSKVGYLSVFMENINLALSKYIVIDLKQKEFVCLLSGTNKKDKIIELKENIIKGFLNSKCINIIDYEDSLNATYKDELIIKFTKYFNKKIDVKFTKNLTKDVPTFVFINEKHEYKDNDPYLKLKKQNKLTQMITYKIAKSLLREDVIFEALLKELMIKTEIVNNKFYLSTKWSIFKEFIFFIQSKKDDDISYKKIYIDNNEIKTEDLTLLDQLKIQKINKINEQEKNIELIAFKDDDYFVVAKMDQFVLPNFNNCLKIYKNFINNNEIPRLRRKEFRKDTITGSGVNYVIEDNSLIYYSSINTLNPNAKISKANILRKIYFSNLDFDYKNLLNSLDEYFIRNKEFTVLPFVVKYLSEYLSFK
jgi:hypothetical protein